MRYADGYNNFKAEKKGITAYHRKMTRFKKIFLKFMGYKVTKLPEKPKM